MLPMDIKFSLREKEYNICYLQTLTLNGKVITIAGYLPVLAVFDLDDWKLVKVVSLPEYVRTIKSIQFVPQNFDGGYNKTLAVLSGQGALYFYDMYQNDIFSELTSYFEIIKIDCDSSGLYIACTLCSGEVEVYELNQYVSPQSFDLRSCKMNSNEIISTEYKGLSGIGGTAVISTGSSDSNSERQNQRGLKESFYACP
ncbi:hypothetical protein NQ317_004483 [Molorchus minor]|uniref:Uncharacterized protein n=1 Tax=Molorchus minor TaxID=1323400 RepID=A0ABQ9IUT9_9CUCU|nr:hypothetical protein NQ317_004483 [Molorchus minor]